MIGLDRLMERKGVVAAGQFASDGSVVRAVGELDEQDMQRVAHLCAAHQREAGEISADLHHGTQLNLNGLNGWVLWSGTHALCVSGDTGVLVDAARADFNQLMVDLFGPPAAGLPAS